MARVLGLGLVVWLLVVESQPISFPLDVGQGSVPDALAEFSPLVPCSVACLRCFIPGVESLETNRSCVFDAFVDKKIAPGKILYY